MKLLSKNILKQSVRNNWKLWLVIAAVLCFFITVLTIAVQSSAGNAPINPNNPMGSILSVYGMMLFGMQGVLIMLLYSVIIGNKLVASEIDRGTMSFILNTPPTRKQLIFSKALFYIVSILAIIVLMGVFGTIICSVVGADMDYGKLWTLALGLFLLTFAISGICFAASCWFNKSSHSLMVGAGLPVAFWLCNMFKEIPNLEFLKYISINTLFDTSAVISGSGFIIQFVALFVIGVALYAVGILKFLKKDLPL
ncbi:MAG: ABC transporter permease [Christensenellaceae bacterium]|jgi:ABC-2 type transport system permease protein|nr:ABC transporter permease [Christensenellaceae bacterium]